MNIQLINVIHLLVELLDQTIPFSISSLRKKNKIGVSILSEKPVVSATADLHLAFN